MIEERINPLQIYQLLPCTDCKTCGCETCLAFAFDLVSREKTLADCPDLQKEEFSSSLELLKEYFGEEITEADIAESGHFIKQDKCVGCGDCIMVCSLGRNVRVRGRGGMPGSSESHSVLKVIDGVIQVINPYRCKRKGDPPEYCRACAMRCPFGALELVR
jgi:4Fe-4S ferredoxin